MPEAKEVTNEQFKEVYFRLGGGIYTGWTADYWRGNFENDKPGVKYFFEEPESPKQTRMFIDSGSKGHRIYFMTEGAEESFFEFPGEE